MNRTINIFNIKCSAGIIPLSFQVPQGTRKDKKTERKKERNKERKKKKIKSLKDGTTVKIQRQKDRGEISGKCRQIFRGK